MPVSQTRWTIAIVCVLLTAITWLVFAPSLRHGFANYDDNDYVYQNPIITKGVTILGVKGAFTRSHAKNWHPLTTISHMLDCQVYGLKAGGHHFTNLLLHTISVLLLFSVLHRMTGALWRSAFVASVFAVHPQHVESVVWIAERKDVLSGIFFMLTLLAYTRYARKPSLLRYITMSILFACGLMSKPMLVTLPFVLLLLDYWPLGRFARTDVSKSGSKSRRQRGKSVVPKLFLEKVPLLVLAIVSSIITFVIQVSGKENSAPLPLLWRLENAVVSYVTYIRQMMWPVNLAPFYPHPENQLPLWEIIFAVVFLSAITFLVIRYRRAKPYLFTGWFWFLGMLVPVIGIVEVGAQGWADRYMYLPQIGLALIAAWGIVDLAASCPYRRQILGVGATVIIIALAWCASIQASYWRDNETLWNHTLAVTSQNHVANNNLGSLFFDRGQIDAALLHHEQAVAIRSQHRTTGQDFLLALYHNNVASGLLRKGRPDEAIAHCQEALKYKPDYEKIYLNLGAALMDKGKIDETIAVFQQAVRLHSDDAAVYNAVAGAFRRQGAEEQAISYYEKALQVDSESVTALNNLAWILSTSVHDSVRDGAKAVTLAERAARISGGENPFFLHKLAAAYAETGNFALATQTAERALQLANEQNNSALGHELERNLALYRTNRPLRDTRGTNVAPSP